jgi:hypothetical protein
LKSLNWYTQNPALEKLTGEKLNGASADSLFVLGRNILQAANGSAHAAADWIRRFPEHTQGMKPAKRKAVLDGIVFEIFFDSQGEPRKRPKINFFSETFDLEQYPEFKDSFDFIAGALANQASHMFAIPGKGRTVTADVRVGDGNVIEGVFVGGENYLSEDPFDLGDDRKIFHHTLTGEDFESGLSQQMLVPRRLLKVVYSRPVQSTDKLQLPHGVEVSRPA